MNLKNLVGAVICAFASATAIAQAQDFPTRPITIVVPFSAGGGNDIAARLISTKMSEYLGQQVLVENKPGADTMIGVNYVLGEPADGYTLLIAGTSTLGTTPHTRKTAGYTYENFDAVATINEYSLVVAASANAPFSTISELVTYAKDNPGKARFAITGPGGSVRITQEIMNRSLGIETKSITYPGAAPALTDVVGGRIELTADNPLVLQPHAKAGALKLLGVAGPVRTEILPDVPTFTEAGYADVNMPLITTLVARKGTPREVLEKLNAAVKFALEDDSIQSKFKGDGYRITYGSLEESSEAIKEHALQWKGYVEEIGISLD